MKAWLGARRFNFIDTLAIVFCSRAIYDGKWIAFFSLAIAFALASGLVERSVAREVPRG